MNIQEYIPLAGYTTFKIGGPARFFCAVTNEDELAHAVTFAQEKGLRLCILGGGSNVLMGDAGFQGLVIKMDIPGINEVIHQKSAVESDTAVQSVELRVGAGVQWDMFVEYAVEHSLYGVENLSAIPGTVGASPVQNIGAYGAEVSRIISKVRAYDIHTHAFVELPQSACQFSYRESLFKKEKGRYVITRVDFVLSPIPTLDLEYKDVKDYFAMKHQESGAGMSPTLREVRDAIIDIRKNKLPDWNAWGTAGSFFKNPLISVDTFLHLTRMYPELPGYPESDGRIKVSLGWILDKVCNLKGLCKGNVCVYEKQALVLVAKPGATSSEVVELAQDIMHMVKDKTGIDIEGEVEWVN